MPIHIQRSIAATALLVASVAAVSVLATPPVQNDTTHVVINPARDLSEGTLRYSMLMNGRSTTDTGGVTMEATYTTTTRRQGDQVMLEDAFTVMGREIHTKYVCAMDRYLTMDHGSMSMTKGDAVLKGTMQRNGDTVTIKANEQEAQLDFPAGTVLQSAVLRLVPLLPRTEGATFTFGGFCETVEFRPRAAPPGEPFAIECIGRRTEQVDGQDVPCTGYAVRSGKDWQCFVNDGGQLCLMIADGGSTRLELKGTPATANAPDH